MLGTVKKVTGVVMAAALCFGAFPVVSSGAKPSLSAKNVTIKVGAKKTVKLKNASAAKWSIVKGKKLVTAKFYKKKAVIKAKKAGTVKILAKVGNKSLYCTVKIKAKPVVNEEPVPVIEDGTETAAAGFAIDTLKKLRENDKENTLVSPDSIMTALVMTGYGAKGTTKEGMEKALGISSIEDCGDYLGTLHKRLAQSPKSYYSAADSIWVEKDDVILLDSFVNKNKEVFDADVFAEPFNDETVKKINSWVDEKTKSMIPDIIRKLEKDDVMVLLNAVCFEGKWSVQYEDFEVNKDGKFTDSKGNKQTVTMLSGEEGSYLQLEGGTGFVKYYEDGNFAFMALLPPEGEDVDTYLKKLSGNSLISAYKNRTFCDVLTKMPEFSYDYSATLNDTLKSMGMEEAFSNYADFSGIADFEKMTFKGMHIDRVIHKTHIELDRYGTKAAAATAVAMAKNTSIQDPPKKKEVYLDRPFVYGIIDTKTGMPLFLGTVDRVTK